LIPLYKVRPRFAVENYSIDRVLKEPLLCKIFAERLIMPRPMKYRIVNGYPVTNFFKPAGIPQC
jgi:hypothetical protein